MAIDVPQIGAQSFTCPTCNAKAHQSWFSGYAFEAEENEISPILTPESYSRVMANISTTEERDKFNDWAQRVWRNELILESKSSDRDVVRLTNLFISQCYSCKEVALWAGSNLLFPYAGIEAVPNQDMPADVKADFEEAARIVKFSPRGAAALLRLCVQKLMPHVGEHGKNINDDIASLVRKGLPAQIQQALDVVRVVGNNAVHPGTISFDDTGAVANSLFNCVNLIVERMITQKRMLEGLFDGLPERAREAIKRRDSDQS